MGAREEIEIAAQEVRQSIGRFIQLAEKHPGEAASEQRSMDTAARALQLTIGRALAKVAA